MKVFDQNDKRVIFELDNPMGSKLRCIFELDGDIATVSGDSLAQCEEIMSNSVLESRKREERAKDLLDRAIGCKINGFEDLYHALRGQAETLYPLLKDQKESK
jgi:hypothetical protein